MTSRRRISKRDRVKIFDAADGICHLCGVKIQIGEEWDVEHPLALSLGGSDHIDDLRPAHVACHKTKTADDHRMRAKADRQRAKHLGVRKRRTIGYRRFDGTPVWPEKGK